MWFIQYIVLYPPFEQLGSSLRHRQTKRPVYRRTIPGFRDASGCNADYLAQAIFDLLASIWVYNGWRFCPKETRNCHSKILKNQIGKLKLTQPTVSIDGCSKALLDIINSQKSGFRRKLVVLWLVKIKQFFLLFLTMHTVLATELKSKTETSAHKSFFERETIPG